MNLEWNVYRHDINKQEIVTYNIFDHGGFCEDVKKAFCTFEDRDEFVDSLKMLLMYYFWCKSEYEVVVGPWVGGKDCKDLKIDIYAQVMNNWERFAEYVWSKRGEV